MTRLENGLEIRKDGAVLRLTIRRAEARNALNEPLMATMRAAFDAAGEDSELRVIVLTGEGDRAFCAGADLKPDAGTFGYDYSRPTTVYADLFRAVRRCTLPIVARVNGHCLAGGMGLLAMCDMAVASASARFGLPEVKVGMFPMQVATVLQHLIPRRRFVEMCLTGEPVDAAEALAMDLVNHVVPAEELDAKTEWLVARLLDKSPTAIRRGKHALAAIDEMTFEQSIAYTETQIGTMIFTRDAEEGLKAFNEKRAPVWTGR